jgi:hypothetical protein
MWIERHRVDQAEGGGAATHRSSSSARVGGPLGDGLDKLLCTLFRTLSHGAIHRPGGDVG